MAQVKMQTARTTHGTRVARVDVEHILDMLQDMSPEQRAAVPGLNPARADIIVAGTEILLGEIVDTNSAPAPHAERILMTLTPRQINRADQQVGPIQYL